MTDPSDRPDPTGIIAGVLKAPHVQDMGILAIAIHDALDAAGCLRTHVGDWPNIPDGAVFDGSVRITSYLAPGEDPDPLYSTTYTGTSYSGALGLLSLAADDLLEHRRREQADDAG